VGQSPGPKGATGPYRPYTFLDLLFSLVSCSPTMATFTQRQKLGLDGSDQTLQDHAQQWVLDVLGQDHPLADCFNTPPNLSFSEALQNGVVLCHLVNRLADLISANDATHLGHTLDPTTTEFLYRIKKKKINTQNKPFKKMENITSFVLAARSYGVPDEELFTTSDLYHNRNTRNVVAALHALSRRVQLRETWQGPIMGEKYVEPEPIAEPKKDKWIELQDEEGRTYYYNELTEETAWHLPGKEPAEEQPAVDQWEALLDDEGKTYFYNATTGVTQWEAPDGYATKFVRKSIDSSSDDEEEVDGGAQSSKEKIRKFNIGHVTVHDSVVTDFAILKARRGRSWMVLAIEEDEKVVYVEDSGDQYADDVELCKGLVRALPGGKCRYAMVDLDKLMFLSWIPKNALGHLQMMYSSQIGTVTSYGGDKFTNFRGLHEIKTKDSSDVRTALLGTQAKLARKAQRKVMGRSTSAAVKKVAKNKPVSKFMASARKTVDDSESDEEWDPDA
jgi:hypothetical protein